MGSERHNENETITRSTVKRRVLDALFCYYELYGFSKNPELTLNEIAGVPNEAKEILSREKRPYEFSERGVFVSIYPDMKITVEFKGLEGFLAPSANGKNEVILFIKEVEERPFLLPMAITNRYSDALVKGKDALQRLKKTVAVLNDGEFDNISIAYDTVYKNSYAPCIWVAKTPDRLTTDYMAVAGKCRGELSSIITDKGRLIMHETYADKNVPVLVTLEKENLFREACKTGRSPVLDYEDVLKRFDDLWGKPEERDSFWGPAMTEASRTRIETFKVYLGANDISDFSAVSLDIAEKIKECQKHLDDNKEAILADANKYLSTHQMFGEEWSDAAIKFEFLDVSLEPPIAALSRWERKKDSPIVDEGGRFTLQIPSGVGQKAGELKAFAKAFMYSLSKSLTPHDIRAVITT